MKDKGYVLLRKFIHDRLYHPKLGYFCRPGIRIFYIDLQVGEMKKSLDFKSMIGYSDYT